MFYYLWDVPIFMAMGAVGGVMGAGFCHFNVKVTQFRHKCACGRPPDTSSQMSDLKQAICEQAFSSRCAHTSTGLKGIATVGLKATHKPAQFVLQQSQRTAVKSGGLSPFLCRGVIQQ